MDEPNSSGSDSTGVRVVRQAPIEDRDSNAGAGPDLRGPIPQLDLPAHEAPGRTLHVKGDHPTSGSGRPGDPWNDLQRALCRLKPGDRLLVWPSTYMAPIEVDGDCLDGTPDRPIEVVVSGAARILGPETGEPVDRPALRIARSHWHFSDLEVEPRWHGPAVLIGPNVRDVRFVGAHVLKGVGSGFEIAHGVRDVAIEDAHLHHLGRLGGSQRAFRNADTAGVSIAPGTIGVVVSNVEIHHMEGEAIRMLPPDRYALASGLPEAADVVIEGVSARALLGNWD